MRINYSEEEDYPGQFELWQANCVRSLKGKDGQAELRVLRDALLALPEKRLIHGSLVDEDGEVCAIGAYVKHKGLDLEKFAPDRGTDEVGIAAGMPRLVAWKVVEENDHVLHDTWRPEGGYRLLTPEERYEGMLAWVESLLTPEDQRYEFWWANGE